jgi:hypothetical protein
MNKEDNKIMSNEELDELIQENGRKLNVLYEAALESNKTPVAIVKKVIIDGIEFDERVIKYSSFFNDLQAN